MKNDNYKTIPKELFDILKEIPKAALAYSGGVDSNYLLYAAKNCGVDIKPYYIKSDFQPEFELKDAIEYAKQLGFDLRIIPLDILKFKEVYSNSKKRCYHCKRNILSKILEEANMDGYEILLDGNNASDMESDRPGMTAGKELNIISPLRIGNLTKDLIRYYSKKANLPSWNKPAYSCLATRITTDTKIEKSLLIKVEKAENFLFDLGFDDFRVRVLNGEAKIQLKEDQIFKLIKNRKRILDNFSNIFKSTNLDLKTRD